LASLRSRYPRVRRPLGPPLFPYTTLFRSGNWLPAEIDQQLQPIFARLTKDIKLQVLTNGTELSNQLVSFVEEFTSLDKHLQMERSEEHTSELQSRFDLVCRLLLEKKKKQK